MEAHAPRARDGADSREPSAGSYEPASDSNASDSLEPSVASHARDLEIARAAIAGSGEARREFVERMACVPRFLAVMNARMGRPFTDDALEDVTQETLVEIWRRLDSYAGHASLKTWAHRFCQQVLSSRLRSTRRRSRDQGLQPANEAGTRLVSSLDYEHVYQALEKVDATAARIVRYKHFEHLTFEQIARRLRIPPSSAKTHYHRALTRLREILAPLRKEAGL